MNLLLRWAMILITLSPSAFHWDAATCYVGSDFFSLSWLFWQINRARVNRVVIINLILGIGINRFGTYERKKNVTSEFSFLIQNGTAFQIQYLVDWIRHESNGSDTALTLPCSSFKSPPPSLSYPSSQQQHMLLAPATPLTIIISFSRSFLVTLETLLTGT